MKRIALLVGINKYDCGQNLNGCLNDVEALNTKLQKIGFDSIAILRDAEACAKNWLEALRELISMGSPGDMLFHAHSHHGAQIKDTSEADGLAEVWCPPDFDWSPEHMITDKQMKAALDMLNISALFTDWADCCHASDSLRGIAFKGALDRFIPNPDIDILGARQIVSHIVVDPRPNVLQLAACRSEQTSADAFIDGRYCGAYTHYGLEVWDEFIRPLNGELIDATALRLSRYGYGQRPEYVGTAENAKRFILE